MVSINIEFGRLSQELRFIEKINECRAVRYVEVLILEQRALVDDLTARSAKVLTSRLSIGVQELTITASLAVVVEVVLHQCMKFMVVH